jgi:hypothetical protein
VRRPHLLGLADATCVLDDPDGLTAAIGQIPLPGSRRSAVLSDHEGVPRGTAARFKRRYAVRLTVPRRGGWRDWGAVRADFERAPADPAIATAEVASELRRGADYVRVTLALTVLSTDVADAPVSADQLMAASRRDHPLNSVSADPRAARDICPATNSYRRPPQCADGPRSGPATVPAGWRFPAATRRTGESGSGCL